MQPLDISNKMEKGEYSHLLNDDVVKPLPAAEHQRKPFSWTRCLIRTLIIAVTLFFLTLTVIGVGSYCWTRHQVRRFTVSGADANLPNPPLPVSPMPVAQVEVVKDKAKLFWDELRSGLFVPQEDLVVTQDELNGLIARSSDYLRGHAYVTITENKWNTLLALPADPLPGGKGRYFVGHGAITTPATEQEEDDSSSSSSLVNHVVTELTSSYPVPGIDFANLLLGKFSVYRNNDNNKIDDDDDDEDGSRTTVELDYGQFLNWVAPEDWIARRENLLRCDDFDDDSSDSSGSSSSSSSDSSSDDEDSEHDDDGCQEFMDTIARLESITLQHGKIVFTPIRNNNNNNDQVGRVAHNKGGRRRRMLTTENVKKASSSSSSPWPGVMFRRALRAAF